MDLVSNGSRLAFSNGPQRVTAMYPQDIGMTAASFGDIILEVQAVICSQPTQAVLF